MTKSGNEFAVKDWTYILILYSVSIKNWNKEYLPGEKNPPAKLDLKINFHEFPKIGSGFLTFANAFPIIFKYL